MWALNRREAGLRAQLPSEDLRVLRDVGRAIVGQHLDDRRRKVCPEAPLDCLEHDVADVGTADPGVHHGPPDYDLTVVASMMKAPRTMSPFQQVNSNPSEHQRRFERMTMTLPS